jgi:hypothetical protein
VVYCPGVEALEKGEKVLGAQVQTRWSIFARQRVSYLYKLWSLKSGFWKWWCDAATSTSEVSSAWLYVTDDKGEFGELEHGMRQVRLPCSGTRTHWWHGEVPWQLVMPLAVSYPYLVEWSHLRGCTYPKPDQ